jgi:hypothetical protein
MKEKMKWRGMEGGRTGAKDGTMVMAGASAFFVFCYLAVICHVLLPSAAFLLRSACRRISTLYFSLIAWRSLASLCGACNMKMKTLKHMVKQKELKATGGESQLQHRSQNVSVSLQAGAAA